jgi:uncharacterized membrane protein YedE/YeeE
MMSEDNLWAVSSPGAMLQGLTAITENRMMQSLFPLGWGHYFVGGLLIGLGVSLLFVITGWIGGMSSVFSSTWSFVSRRAYFQNERFVGTRVWRLVFAAGLVIGAAIWWAWLGPSGRLQTGIPVWQLGVGGVLVGFGSRLSNGCTSGHGICGLSSLQWPSLAAVLTFMATGALSANMVLFLGRH